LPDYYGGLQQRFSYKGVSLDLLLQFVKQKGINYYKVNNGENIYPGQFASGYSNQPTTVLSRWRQPGDRSSIAAYTTLFNISYLWIPSSDYLYQDASYIRLKNLSLSWDLPMQWYRSAHLKNLRIYIQAQNLFTITRFKGVDPESQNSGSLPPLRVITGGLQMGL
jgi:hypothetical protein